MQKRPFKTLRRIGAWTLSIVISTSLYYGVAALSAKANSGLNDSYTQQDAGSALKNAVDNSEIGQMVKQQQEQQDNSAVSNSNSSDSSSTSSSSDTGSDDRKNKEREDSSFTGRMIGDFFDEMGTTLAKAGFTTIDKLVFGLDPASIAVFAQQGNANEFDAISPIYYGFFALSWVLLIGVVIKNGLHIARGKNNPRVRARIGDYMIDLGVGVLLICFSWFIVYYLADWNSILMRFVAPNFSSKSELSSLEVYTGNYATSAFVRLVLIGMSIFINILYVCRKFMLIGSVMIGPFVGLGWASGNKRPFGIWLSETITNAFLPFSHALVFSMYFRLLDWSNKHNAGLMNKWWVAPVVMFFLIPVSAYFRQFFTALIYGLMGQNESYAAKTDMMGITGIRGMANLVGSTLGSFAGTSLAMKSQGSKTQTTSKQTSGGVGSSSVLTNVGAPSMGTSATQNTGLGQPSPTALSTLSATNPTSSGMSGGVVGSASMDGSPGAGNTPYYSSPSAMNGQEKGTVIGQATGQEGARNTPPGIHRMNQRIAQGHRIGSKVLGATGKVLGGATGLAMDVAATAVTGRPTNFRGALANAGSAMGQRVGATVGGIGGAGVGIRQSIREQKRMAQEQGMRLTNRQAFHQAMGFQQPHSGSVQLDMARSRAARNQFIGTMAGSAFSPNVSAKLGNYMAERTMRRSLERLSIVKMR
ncbi:hypothetical protein [Collibacillus ludicampi]|uniref:hypothetical protein n=1 Tax=Collibacillus ludicampi TaxID=2771369 RepID=UPI0024954BB8|nr:hypothetical protein [Collibacillus ludicampi]